MSGQSDDSRQETTQDVFLYRSRDPHTAIPDWLAFCRTISSEARSLAHAIIVMSQGPLPPTKPEIAERLGVDVRTVYRWLNELNSAGVMHTRTVGRRNLYIFTNPSTSDRLDQMTNGSDDPCATDRLDQMTNGSDDPCASHDPLNRDRFLEQQEALNGGFSENPISDPAGGGGGSSFSLEKEPPTPTAPARKITPADITTDTGRWMMRVAKFGLTKAYLLQHLPLADCEYDFELRRSEFRQGPGAIAQAWEVEAPPPAPIASAPELDDEQLLDQVDDQADEFLPEPELRGIDQLNDTIDATERALFREKVKRDLLESANRRPYSYHGGKR